MQPDDKDAALLPRRIDGQFALIHRPATDSGSHVWISSSPDLHNWGNHKLMLPARKGSWWDANKVGLSPPLIETTRGWLMLYHGVRHTAAGCLYRLGAALFALDEPQTLPGARRLVDLRTRGALRARRGRRQRRLPVRVHARSGRRHPLALLRRGRHLRRAVHGRACAPCSQWLDGQTGGGGEPSAEHVGGR